MKPLAWGLMQGTGVWVEAASPHASTHTYAPDNQADRILEAAARKWVEGRKAELISKEVKVCSPASPSKLNLGPLFEGLFYGVPHSPFLSSILHFLRHHRVPLLLSFAIVILCRAGDSSLDVVFGSCSSHVDPLPPHLHL